MKPETNLFLRSLIGREKSRLKRQKESREQQPATPPLSPDTVRIIRRSLKVHKDAVESSFAVFAPLLRDEKDKARAESSVTAARRAIIEFNAAYPEKVRR